MTGDCARARRVLPFLLEGEAEPSDALRAAAHLASCASCRGEAGRDTRVIAELRSLGEVTPPRDIVRDVVHALRSVRVEAPRALKWSAIALLTAMLAVPGLRPWERSGLTWRILARVGEVLHPGELLARLAGLLPKLLSSPLPLIDALSAGQTASGALGALRPGHPGFPLLLLLIASLTAAVFSGCALLGGYMIARPRRRSRSGDGLF